MILNIIVLFNSSPQWPNNSDRVGDRKNILTLEEINALCTCFNVFSCCLGTTNLIFNKRSQPLWIFIISLFVQQCCIPWLSSLGCKDRTKHTKVVRWYHKHLSLHVATYTHTTQAKHLLLYYLTVSLVQTAQKI